MTKDIKLDINIRLNYIKILIQKTEKLRVLFDPMVGYYNRYEYSEETRHFADIVKKEISKLEDVLKKHDCL